jgi:outer membrane protein, heavy metal efflux system
MAHLASAIGRPESSIGKLEGTLKEVFGVEEIKALAEEGALQVQLAEKDVETRVLRERLARLEQIPDVDLEVLYRQDRGSRKEGLDLGLTMSLPLFDRGRAKIREATADVSAAQARLEWQQNRTRLRQLEIGERLGASVATFHQLQEEILPRLEKLVSKAELRHQAGDVAFTEVLTFQTRLLVKRTSFMETLSDLMEVWRELAWD